MTRFAHNISKRLTTWFAIRGGEMRNIAIVALGCLLIGGARFFDPVERVGYHTATVHSVTSVSSRVNPRVRIAARIGPDRIVPVTLKCFTTHVEVGDRICLMESRGTLRGRHSFSPARPSRCDGADIVPLNLLVRSYNPPVAPLVTSKV